MSVVALDEVNWRRGGKLVLRDITWHVDEGQHWSIVGANGSGKSTMLGVVAGYIWPTTGRVTVLGQRYGTCSLPEMRRRIGWVTSQLTSTFLESHPHETAQDVVRSGRYASIGMYEDEDGDTREEASELLSQFGCSPLADVPFHILSQGEKQRVLLARAWMAHPEILILDEPCTGLDVLARERLLQSLERMAAGGGPTILYVTHHVEEILPMFTHAILLRDGGVVASGEKRHVLTSDGLSNALEVRLEVTWSADRPWVKVANR